MKLTDLVVKAEVLLEALPYIQRFKGSTFVVKFGGSFMDDPGTTMGESVAQDIVLLAAVGINVVIVHGGGKAISQTMHEEGLVPEFRNGLRVTSADAIKIVERTLNRTVNQEICGLLASKNGRPLGLPGNEIFLCKKLLQTTAEGEPVDLGFVGDIQKVKPEIIDNALLGGYIPVVSSIATDLHGTTYNTNADAAAAHASLALEARRLVYLCDVPGLLRDPEQADSVIPTLKIEEAGALRDEGIIGSGMLPKVDSAIIAIEGGVRRVHFVDGRMPHSILLEIFTDRGIGTEIIQTPDL